MTRFVKNVLISYQLYLFNVARIRRFKGMAAASIIALRSVLLRTGSIAGIKSSQGMLKLTKQIIASEFEQIL